MIWNLVIYNTYSSTDLDVSISVEYTPPPDFYMPSPPYYRPASSVTLECVVANGTTPMRYSWTSTCDNCFASYGSSKHVSTDILIHEDAGTHKCSVTDADGNTGFATTEMQLIGIFGSMATVGFSYYNIYFPSFYHHRCWCVC